MKRSFLAGLTHAVVLVLATLHPLPCRGEADEISIARIWNEECLNAIRNDTARPPVHARNLFHLSLCMWEGWAAYDEAAPLYFSDDERTSDSTLTTPEARAKTISFAAYRFLTARYAASANAAVTLANLKARMEGLGYDIQNASTVGQSAAAAGNRIALRMLGRGLVDGANETNNYAATNGYTPVNPPMIVARTGNPGMVDPNRWQALALSYFVDQNGVVIPTGYPPFVCPHWGSVTPFAMTPSDRSTRGNYLDPGPPPMLGLAGDAEFKAGHMQVVEFSGQLTPDDGVVIDRSPGTFGNNPLGTNNGTGHPVNPFTGQPYAPNPVKRGDWTRVMAEFWADGPHSETPPGHWNVLANQASDQITEKRIGGTGPLLDRLEWDVKLYLVLNGALHDAAVVCWGNKGYYDTVRPISALRYMSDKGQCSDPKLPRYHPHGVPLIPGVSELITVESSAPGQRHEELAAHVGKIAFYTWPGNPADPLTQYGGAKWILAGKWLPYQLATFVTPPFAGYFSGHSTYSRSAAEVLTRFTGSEYFPGGLGVFTAAANQYLTFELGPSEDVQLQYATYYDAADQAGISRIYGGIHPDFDDFTGRRVGAQVGEKAWNRAAVFLGLAPAPTPTPSPTPVPLGGRIKGYILGQSDDKSGLDPNGDLVVDTADLVQSGL